MSSHRHHRTPRLLSGSWVSFLLVLLLSPLNTGAANLTGLSLTPPNPTLNINETLQLIATGIYDDGTQQVMVQAKQVSAGYEHSCALSADGTIKCWGGSGSGQLGNGSFAYAGESVPVTVSGISAAVAVSAGYEHTCAVLADGTARCWGDNSGGQLGRDDIAAPYVFIFGGSAIPVVVSGINNAVKISAGNVHTCAVLADGTARCWGYNGSGQLGDSTTIISPVPVVVSGINNAVAISAGTAHTCAVLADGTIKCWGDNGYGQLGNGTTTYSSIPVAVSGINNAVAISAGNAHTCAVLADGTMRCWGSNGFGQFGNGTTVGSPVPVIVAGISIAVAVNAGYGHTCVVLADGAIKCWGNNDYGQVGNGTYPGSWSPVAVSGINNAAAVSAGNHHTCAALADGAVRCWGRNYFGQLGNGTITGSLTLASVNGLNTAAAVSTGNNHTCTVLADGTARCWGDNTYGQLGDGTTTNSSIPVAVSGINNAVAISAGASMGNAHTCALLTDGTIKCWGYNAHGQLGNGTTINSSIPVTVSKINSAVAVSAGAYHTCATLTNNTVRCWGIGGAIGSPNSGSSTPVAVSGINNAVAISAGGGHSCAVLANGTIQCWGGNYYGQLGNGTLTGSSTPVAVSGIDTAVDVSAGGAHSCAVLADGTVRCWGYNESGQIGNGLYGYNTYSPTPVTVSSINTAKAVNAGYDQTCAVLADRTLRCWGLLNQSKLGIFQPTPAIVGGINNVVAVSGADKGHTCVVLADGTLPCWGDTSNPQNGNGVLSPYYGTPLALGYHPLTWTGSNPSVASVNGVGQAKALSPGTAQITATLNGINTNTTVTVATAGTPPPVVDGFWPGAVSAGGMVIVFGQGFVPMKTQVQVNGILAPLVQVVDPTLLFFPLPSGNTQGPITVTTPNGTATSSLSFGTPLTGVKITGLWPSVATPGQLVIVFGSGFVVNATTVKLNGVDAPIRQVLYPDLMFFMVPPTATTGYVSVTTAAGSATSASLLTIK